MSVNVPCGYCQCGCGLRAPIAKRNNPQKGWRRGEPLRFIRGHNNRQSCGHTIVDNIEDAYVIQENGCWVWKKAVTNKGYGVIWVNGKLILAHRYFWQLSNGVIPPKMSLHHKCANKKCVNPSHLELLSQKQHSNRHPKIKKLTNDHIGMIRRLYINRFISPISQRQLAKMFGISQRQIWRIVNRRA